MRDNLLLHDYEPNSQNSNLGDKLQSSHPQMEANASNTHPEE